MKCSEFNEKLSEFIDGELSNAEEKKMRTHMEKCSDCRAQYDALKALSDAVKDMRTSSLPPEFAKEIIKKTAKPDIPYLWQKYNKIAAVLVAAFAVVIFARGARVNKEFLKDAAAPKPEITAEFAAPVADAADETPVKNEEIEPKQETKKETAVTEKQEEIGNKPHETKAMPTETEPQSEAEEAAQVYPEENQTAKSESLDSDADDAGDSYSDYEVYNSKKADADASNEPTKSASSDKLSASSRSAGGSSARNADTASPVYNRVLYYSMPPADSFESAEAYSALTSRLASLKARAQNGEDVNAEFDAFLLDVSGAMK